MKKNKRTILIAAALTAAAAGLTGCTPPEAPQQDVYGPPPEFRESETVTTDSADTAEEVSEASEATSEAADE